MAMDKKIFDIIPPKRLHNLQEEAAPEVLEKVVVKEPEILEKPVRKIIQKDTNSSSQQTIEDEFFLHGISTVKRKLPRPKLVLKKKTIFLAVLAVILIAGTVSAYFFLPVVRIEIWLKTDNLNVKQEVEINKETKIVDALNHTLPGRIITEEQALSKEFKATGKITKEEKAEGTIRIFNDYSTASQSLVAGTRFVSDEGKLFRLVEKVVVPGQSTEKGKLIPGSVDVLVRADTAGPDYNIGVSTFSIPGFAGTPRYTAFYAKSFLAMAGGFKGESPAVSPEDLENAKKSLTAEVKEKINNVFMSRALPGLVLAQEKNPIIITDDSSSIKPGQTTETFSYEVKAKGRAVLLSEEYLKEIAKTYFINELIEDQKFLVESIKINSLVEEIDEALGAAKLALEISGKTYQDLEAGFVKDQLKGKPVQEVEKSFQELSQISQAKIRIVPSFFKNLPQDVRKVEIKIYFD